MNKLTGTYATQDFQTGSGAIVNIKEYYTSPEFRYILTTKVNER